MTLEDAIKVKESLEELSPVPETFCWGPTLFFAKQRQDNALCIIDKEIERLYNNGNATVSG